MHRLFLLFVLFVALWFSGCSRQQEASSDPIYMAQINAWHLQRVETLTRPDGWLTLAGLFWLQEGENRIGSDPGNDILLPAGKAPKRLGSFFLTSGRVHVAILPRVTVKNQDSVLVTHQEMITDAADTPSRLTCGTLTFFIIKRGDRFGVRLRDREHENRLHFKGIRRYPVTDTWRVPASYVPYEPVKKIKVTNVVGAVTEQDCPGALAFSIDGKNYHLDVLSEGEKEPFFVIIADETSGEETYGGGRFLYVERPDSTGRTFIDFNKAFNPPCAFTPYATCPLPPAQNRLPIAVTAGEKRYEGPSTHES